MMHRLIQCNRRPLLSTLNKHSFIALATPKVFTPSPSGQFHTSATIYTTETTAPSSPDDATPKKSSIYTRTGDAGESYLFNMDRMSKTTDYFQALGDVDELNAQLGVCMEQLQEEELGDAFPLREIQSRLLDIGSHIATPSSSDKTTEGMTARVQFPSETVEELESLIDAYDAQLPPLKNFILPAGGKSSTALHVARAVCRRAERRVIPLVHKGDADAVVLRYINRLSDYLFTAARLASLRTGHEDAVYKKARVRKEKQ